MICAMCAAAADRRADESAHCGAAGGPGATCSCQHRADRYRTPLPPHTDGQDGTGVDGGGG